MNVSAIPHKRPVPVLVTATFVVALAVTAAYFAGLVPGVPKTLPLFVDLMKVTGALLVVAVLAWAASFVVE